MVVSVALDDVDSDSVVTVVFIVLSIFFTSLYQAVPGPATLVLLSGDIVAETRLAEPGNEATGSNGGDLF